jgi:futalosine hydrolase
MRILIATAVPAEAGALRAGLSASGRPSSSSTAGTGLAASASWSPVVEAVGVGPAAAAAGTARLLALAEAAGTPFAAVVSAGIAGGFPGRAPVGGTVIGARSTAADLGAESADGFVPVEQLGFGSSTRDADPALLKALTAALPDAVVGDILTLATVTGTAATADRLAVAHPAAVAEAMEGFGVATAAGRLPFVELRTISNPVGPRDRAAWRLPEALAALTRAAARLAALPAHTGTPS